MVSFRKCWLVVCLGTAPCWHAQAQTKIYLDARVGYGYNFAEGAHGGKGERPFVARNYLGHVLPYLQPRVQLNDRWALTAGYRGSSLSYGYKLQVPPDVSVNPFGGSERGTASTVYMHQFPLEVHYALKRYNFVPLDTAGILHRFGLRLDVFAGGGLNRAGNNCIECANGRIGPPQVTGQTNPNFDVIEFAAQPRYHHAWGGFVAAGATARFFHLGKERLNFSLAFTQGLTDMLLVPVQYSYNGRLGATTLHVRGTGISATMGYPIFIGSFAKREARRPVVRTPRWSP